MFGNECAILCNIRGTWLVGCSPNVLDIFLIDARDIYPLKHQHFKSGDLELKINRQMKLISIWSI